MPTNSDRSLSKKDLSDFVIENFDDRYEIQENGCWIWTSTIARAKVGDLTYEYGVIANRGRNELAHRVSFSMYRRRIPPAMIVGRTCCRTLCVNPDHLELRTISESHAYSYSVCGANAHLAKDIIALLMEGHSPVEIGKDQGWTLDQTRYRVRSWIRHDMLSEDDLPVPLKQWHVFLDDKHGVPRIETIRSMRAMRREGAKYREIVAAFDEPFSTVHETVNGKHYSKDWT